MLTLATTTPSPSATDPVVRSFSGNDTLGVWHFSDGMVVIRVGPANQIGAETIALEGAQIGIVRRALEEIEKAAPLRVVPPTFQKETT